MATRRASSKFWTANYGKPCVGEDIVKFQWYPGLTKNQINIHAGTEPIWAALGAVFLAYNYKVPTSYTGAYACRQVTGGSSWSGHAWPLAMDVNAKTNPYISHKPIIRSIKWGVETDMPAAMIREVEQISASGKQAFWWGGRYKTIKDAMHFEVNVTLADIAGGVSAPRGFYDGGGTVPGTPSTGGEMLKRGDKGNAVGKHQEALIGWDANALPQYGADKDFGGETEEWVKKFQLAANLEQTGIIGAITSPLLLMHHPDAKGGGVGRHSHPATATVAESTKITVKIGENS
ncbi:MAG: M15 family metallopeptidase [Saprospiraceae bacterium]|nr:M15 family metallopeptidase [Saprospiraceae bacterium]